MKKLFWTVVLAMALLGAPGTTMAEFKSPETIGEFLTQCQHKNSLGEMLCIGVIRGVASVLKENVVINRQYGICLTGFTSFGQMQRAFINWANANPKYWQENGELGIRTALMETWPCK